MGLKTVWKADWLVGLLLAIVLAAMAGSDLVQSLERKAYDVGVQLSNAEPSDKIAVIAIDERSIANLGRWPWSRDIHARMVAELSAVDPAAVGYTVFFFEPQDETGLKYIHQLAQMLAQSSLKNSEAPQHQQELGEFSAVLLQAARQLNQDQKLAEEIAASGRVLLPLFFELGEPKGNQPQALPEFVTRNQLTQVAAGEQVEPLMADGVLKPVSVIGAGTAGLGHLNATPDVDGAIRTEPLVVNYYDQYYPSLSLMLAAASLNLDIQDIQLSLGQSVQVGRQRIVTDDDLRMMPFFYQSDQGDAPFQVDSFYDVYSGKIAPEKYRDKIVLIGATAAGVGSLQVTPVAAGMPPVVTLAHSLSSILEGDFFTQPDWVMPVKMAVFVGVALFLCLLLPRLSALAGGLLSAILLLLLLGTYLVSMTVYRVWLPLMLPVLLLLCGYLLLVTLRFFTTESGKALSDADSAESNRMLGLAFQGQGQLDLAFDKFRKIPLDHSLMDVLYNLGLDYERKRQFNKAESVFRYMADYDPDFRDLAQRLKQSHDLAETVILGGSKGHQISGMGSADGVSRPVLGRYQVEKEIGKGAMGAVYLGKDPKIGRVVAIKTMALADEFDADELEDVRQRFFREAETAGRLNHPNIVMMYDAGEEHDLAYIAMEYLKGEDLSRYTAKDNLLPVKQVVDIVAQVADALGYAHGQRVVHRDVKPANIMFDPESGTVKVTDFGIARVTDASKTRTGMVLGTPSYMSPEQLAGKKIDGRSDLFSLGVALYQLSCGTLPFTGESLAQLMYRIANEQAPDIAQLRPELPSELIAIILKALNKDIEDRYQTGDEMASDLRRCADRL